jgi:hypothetical protein
MQTQINHDDVEKAIHKSQHCQRNWDLSKEIPARDLELFETAVGQCPSKQNLAFYRAHFITKREVIEQIHACTDGFVYDFETGASTTNPQTLANLLVIFEEVPATTSGEADPRNTQMDDINKTGGSELSKMTLARDRDMAVGIAAGYLNLTANLFGYSTGCCACFDETGVAKVLGSKNKPVLLMGIGFKSETTGRRVHHKNPDFLFPTKAKQKIEVNVIR